LRLRAETRRGAVHEHELRPCPDAVGPRSRLVTGRVPHVRTNPQFLG